MPKKTEETTEPCEFCGEIGKHVSGCPVSIVVESAKPAVTSETLCKPGLGVGCTFKPSCKKKWGE